MVTLTWVGEHHPPHPNRTTAAWTNRWTNGTLVHALSCNIQLLSVLPSEVLVFRPSQSTGLRPVVADLGL